ncbi:Prophage tail length tape measure protein [Roseovarius mucosus DSM 17069]|uniref:Prophage tail length tape measure protein n=1 Tax=Roseovarius mucosus DSM 17069 TaxID=1288298 RepID=A0A0A0HKU4_9RHOB|nr:phage tail length tape measure family protein [Roseovarius mucosus]KGM86768.1 Prophage tail length tape measure protein [Roseovarius mucosus DSM 17069]
MTLVARAEILMDADQAKAELQATGTAAKGAAQDIRGVGTQGAAAARGVGQLGTAARTSATGLTAASSAAEVNAAATQKVASANRLAAGSMGNLVAQGNDVVQMLIAGQNPLTLAVQQGTQITQVIGPLGAAGAFRALGGAVLSMLSPINLITIGALAATAAVVNWFTSASEEGESFADTVEALETRIDSLKDKIAEASATRLELAERFGEGFVERAQDILDRIVEAEKRMAQREATASINSFIAESGVDVGAALAARNQNPAAATGFELATDGLQFDVARQFELTEGLLGRLRAGNRQLVQEFINDLATLSEAASGTLEEQLAALTAVIESYDALAVASGNRNAQEDAQLLLLRQQQIELARVIELQKQDPAQNRQNEEMLAFLELVTKATGEQLKAEAAAQAMLSTMLEQNAIAEAIAQHGEDSAAVTRLRAQFALNAALAEADASDASVETKDALREAAQAAFEIATSDISGGIRAAADEASRLAAEVRGAVDAVADLQSQGEVGLENARIRAEFRDDPIGRAGALAGARFDRETAVIRGEASGDLATVDALNARREAVVDLARETARLNELARPARNGSRGGSRASSANEIEKERENIDRLIASKQREIDALRETDPVQREMIRLRDRLKFATEGQREAIEAKIEAEIEETAAMERKEEFRDAVGDVLLEAESLRDVWSGIGDMIIRAAKEALILGSGPLGGLFGGSGILGGLVSGIGGGLGDLFGLFSGGSLLSFADGGLPGFASGGDPRVTRPGLLLGTGTGRGDKIPAFVSAGEFIMTAEATARNRAVLEAMNAGAIIPGFAGGGLPLPAQAGSTAGAAGGAGAQGNGVTRLRIEPSELFHAVIEERARDMAIEVTTMGIKQFMRDGLPQAVDRINKDPKRRG